MTPASIPSYRGYNWVEQHCLSQKTKVGLWLSAFALNLRWLVVTDGREEWKESVASPDWEAGSFQMFLPCADRACKRKVVFPFDPYLSESVTSSTWASNVNNIYWLI